MLVLLPLYALPPSLLTATGLPYHVPLSLSLLTTPFFCDHPFRWTSPFRASFSFYFSLQLVAYYHLGIYFGLYYYCLLHAQ